MKPEPFGERFIPPQILTAIGTAEGGNRVVGIALQEAHENNLLVQAFIRMGWRVHTLWDLIDLIGLACDGAHLFIADDLSQIREVALESRNENSPYRIFVASEEFQLLDLAWEYGANCVMLRSIDAGGVISYQAVERPGG